MMMRSRIACSCNHYISSRLSTLVDTPAATQPSTRRDRRCRWRPRPFSTSAQMAVYHPTDPAFRPRSIFNRVGNRIKEDFSDVAKLFKREQTFGQWEDSYYPNHCDLLIVGGGLIGTITAYFLKHTLEKANTIIVIDKSPTLEDSQSVQSLGGVRTQFSTEANVKMAIYTAKFLREFERKLSIRNNRPEDILFQPQGYLFLGTFDDVSEMQRTHEMQIGAGANVALMEQEQLHRKFPWMNVDDVRIGSYGLEHEGWFDTFRLMKGLRNKAMSHGVYFLEAELLDIAKREQEHYNFNFHASLSGIGMPIRSNKAWVRSPNRGIQPITYFAIINAAGAYARTVAEMNGIGTGEGVLSIPLPIEKRRRLCFSFTCRDGPSIDMPILVDPLGFFVRREGLTGGYLCGYIPKSNEDEFNPEVTRTPSEHEAFFTQYLWPRLTHRIPAFETLKYNGAWEAEIDWNYFDHSPIIGPHPYIPNHYFACGTSGMGIAASAGIGRAIEEMIFESQFFETNLESYYFNRFINFEPIAERLVV